MEYISVLRYNSVLELIILLLNMYVFRYWNVHISVLEHIFVLEYIFSYLNIYFCTGTYNSVPV